MRSSLRRRQAASTWLWIFEVADDKVTLPPDFDLG
jgi:hypothetical protein